MSDMIYVSLEGTPQSLKTSLFPVENANLTPKIQTGPNVAPILSITQKSILNDEDNLNNPNTVFGLAEQDPVNFPIVKNLSPSESLLSFLDKNLQSILAKCVSISNRYTENPQTFRDLIEKILEIKNKTLVTKTESGKSLDAFPQSFGELFFLQLFVNEANTFFPDKPLLPEKWSNKLFTRIFKNSVENYETLTKSIQTEDNCSSEVDEFLSSFSDKKFPTEILDRFITPLTCKPPISENTAFIGPFQETDIEKLLCPPTPQNLLTDNQNKILPNNLKEFNEKILIRGNYVEINMEERNRSGAGSFFSGPGLQGNQVSYPYISNGVVYNSFPISGNQGNSAKISSPVPWDTFKRKIVNTTGQNRTYPKDKKPSPTKTNTNPIAQSCYKVTKSPPGIGFQFSEGALSALNNIGRIQQTPIGQVSRPQNKFFKVSPASNPYRFGLLIQNSQRPALNIRSPV